MEHRGWRNRWRVPVKPERHAGTAPPSDTANNDASAAAPTGPWRTAWALARPLVGALSVVVIGVLAQRAWQEWRVAARHTSVSAPVPPAQPAASAPSQPRRVSPYRVIPFDPQPLPPGSLPSRCDVGGEVRDFLHGCPPGSIVMPVDIPPGWTPPKPLPPPQSPCEHIERQIMGLRQIGHDYPDDASTEAIQEEIREREQILSQMKCAPGKPATR